MGRKDVLTQNYMKQNDKFADLCNFFLFDGEPVIKPDDLSEKDATELGLSGMTAHDRIRPVITITVYWKTGAWNGPRSIHEMLDVEDESILRFVPNYEMNLIVPDEITDFTKFKTELENVMQFLGYADKSSELRKLREEKRTNDWLSREAVELINACTGARLSMPEGKERLSMCEALEKLRAEDKAEGIAEGKTEGKIELLVDLVNENIITLDVAAKKAGMSVEEFKTTIKK